MTNYLRDRIDRMLDRPLNNDDEPGVKIQQHGPADCERADVDRLEVGSHA